MKPGNILINSDTRIKLADFGLARSIGECGGEDTMSDYVATRWYRAPEILLGSTSYGRGVDVWSAGTILAEMVLQRVLFQGKSSIDQVQQIMNLLGRPSGEDLAGLDIKGNH